MLPTLSLLSTCHNRIHLNFTAYLPACRPTVVTTNQINQINQYVNHENLCGYRVCRIAFGIVLRSGNNGLCTTVAGGLCGAIHIRSSAAFGNDDFHQRRRSSRSSSRLRDTTRPTPSYQKRRTVANDEIR